MLSCFNCFCDVFQLISQNAWTFLDSSPSNTISEVSSSVSSRLIDDDELYLDGIYPFDEAIARHVFIQCHQMMKSLPMMNRTDNNLLIRECAVRWQELHHQIQAQRLRYLNSSGDSQFYGIGQENNRKRLLLLDLDETIKSSGDVRMDMTDAKAINYSIIRQYNERDLVFSTYIGSEVMLTIYAPHLMNLIHSTMRHICAQQIDIAIYTNSVDLLAEYEVIFIEMYYAHVFRIKYKNDLDMSQQFRFKFLLSRIPFDFNPSKKTLDKVVQSVDGFCMRYSNVIIVDDNGKDAWNDTIPQQFTKANISVQAIVAQKFKFVRSGTYLRLKNTTYRELYGCQWLFEFLDHLFYELHKPQTNTTTTNYQKRLKWKHWRYLNLW